MIHEFEAHRQKMVDNQIRPSDVTNLDLLDAFLSVKREEFVPENLQPFAYIDEDLRLSNERFLMEPAQFAKLLQACRITSDDMVLDIGCTTGYTTAVMAQLASFVVGLENNSNLAESAQTTLEALEISNASIIVGDLTKGHQKEAPYDVIFVGGSISSVPVTLLDQLNEGGRLACVLGYGNSAKATIYTKIDGRISSRSIFNASVKPLPGFEKTVEFTL